MLDESTLRQRFPEIPWDQPQEIHVLPVGFSPTLAQMNTKLVEAMMTSRWVCRWCVALHGVSAHDLRQGLVPFAFVSREACLDHIEREHHD